ncbi:hypothetical protein FB451DRAFT_1415997 [Mycena latifolia]|nr:hypothetical protein FB451DRAFT_1415997 [Mycena latifolia]
MLPLRMLQTRFCGRKFCQEIDEVTLTEAQIGKIRLPLYMDPNYPDHENPALTKIFNAALLRVAQILADFDDTHPVIASCNKYFSRDLKTKKKKEKPEVSNWMRTLGLVPTPELEAVLLDPLEPERNKRVMGVGSVLFQILGIQQELGEELNLNGDLIRELVDGSVVPCQHDGAPALERMFAAIPLPSAKSAVLVKRMLRFNTVHSIFDPMLRPPTYRPREVEALDLEVRQNPQASAQQLRAGAWMSQMALGSINPILLDPRKARSEVEKSKVRQDLIPSAARNTGFQLLESFSALKNSFETPWIVASDLLDQQFICMQTPFMRNVLLRD